MKILIISDIHANWHALQAVLAKEGYDALVFLGDVVDFGPDPKNCVNFLIKSSKARFWGVRATMTMRSPSAPAATVRRS
jgi:protein phosphatase